MWSYNGGNFLKTVAEDFCQWTWMGKLWQKNFDRGWERVNSGTRGNGIPALEPEVLPRYTVWGAYYLSSEVCDVLRTPTTALLAMARCIKVCGWLEVAGWLDVCFLRTGMNTLRVCDTPKSTSLWTHDRNWQCDCALPLTASYLNFIQHIPPWELELA
jgi:hypothetical protein